MVHSFVIFVILQTIERGENLTILTNKAEDLRDSVSLSSIFDLKNH